MAIYRGNNLQSNVSTPGIGLDPSTIGFVQSETGTINNVEYMSAAVYNALPIKSPTTTYIVDGHPADNIMPSGILTNVEYGTLTPQGNAVTLPGTPQNGYSLNVTFPNTTSIFSYSVTFPTPYNAETDIFEIQRQSAIGTPWIAAHNDYPFYTTSATQFYGLGLGMGSASATFITMRMGGTGLSPINQWNAITWFNRIVKKTFTRTTLSEWNAMKAQVLVNSPHIWPTNGSELFLGDGSFGRRWTGNVTAAANTHANIIWDLPGEGAYSSIAWGGWYMRGGGSAWKWPINTYVNNAGAETLQCYGNLLPGVNRVDFRSFSTNNRDGVNESAFDVWLRYTKG